VTGYPLWDAFVTMLEFFVFVLWFFLLFRVILDIFRSHELSGLAKAAWLFFVIILPFLGVFVYLIARGKNMAEHDQSDAKAQQEAFTRQVQQAAGTSTSAADQLTKLADLHTSGALTDAEYEAQKAKVLA
jgi:hypothetical protein